MSLTTTEPPDDLAAFELPRPFVEPMLRALRLWNTALDSAFYDVGVVTAELFLRGSYVVTDDSLQTAPQPASGAPVAAKAAFAPLDLGAMSNPEGCLLLVDPGKAPYVTRYDRVDSFIAAMQAMASPPAAVSITGVGSSALGSAAFAWNAATALGQPVVAIAPGYGLADVVNQALGGWFGFGLHNWLGSLTQTTLATVAPAAARVGHHLLMSTPGHASGEAGAPVFETGSAASDVLHALLEQVPAIRILLGHSKGALAVANALLSLPPETTARLSVATFGCPIGESVRTARYAQFLGAFDALGQLNAWGNRPEVVIPTQHTTNTLLPMSMPVALLARAVGPGGSSGSFDRLPDASLPAPWIAGVALPAAARQDAPAR